MRNRGSNTAAQRAIAQASKHYDCIISEFGCDEDNLENRLKAWRIGINLCKEPLIEFTCEFRDELKRKYINLFQYFSLIVIPGNAVNKEYGSITAMTINDTRLPIFPELDHCRTFSNMVFGGKVVISVSGAKEESSLSLFAEIAGKKAIDNFLKNISTERCWLNELDEIGFNVCGKQSNNRIQSKSEGLLEQIQEIVQLLEQMNGCGGEEEKTSILINLSNNHINNNERLDELYSISELSSVFAQLCDLCLLCEYQSKDELDCKGEYWN